MVVYFDNGNEIYKTFNEFTYPIDAFKKEYKPNHLTAEKENPIITRGCNDSSSSNILVCDNKLKENLKKLHALVWG